MKPAVHTAPYALELRDVCQHFGPTPVLCEINLAIHPGERVALIGPNGAGKSTLFHLISGTFKPSGGQVWLHGQRIDGKKPFEIARLGLSRSFQISNLFPSLSVLENLRCATLWHLGYGYSFWRFLSRLQDVNQQVEFILNLIDLYSKRHTQAIHLTYAEQRALEIGMTIAGAGNHQVILLDEPTAGMSAGETQHFTELIKKIAQGRTLFTVEHDMGVVFNIADKIAVLDQGRILAFDTPENIRNNDQVQRAYLGMGL